MNTESIINLSSQFLTADFNREFAERVFGPVLDGGVPYILNIKPKEKEHIDRITMITINNDDTVFIESLFIFYNNPLKINVATIIEKFGNPVEDIRLGLNSPIPYKFVINGKDYNGYLIIGLENRSKENNMMIELQYRRFLPKSVY